VRLDPHSFADAGQPVADRLVWQARVDFAGRTLHAEAVLRLQQAAEAGPLDLDTRDLHIDAVTNEADGAALPFELGDPEPILGQRLRINVPAGCQAVRVRYRTAPHATALQWLEPAQTGGGAAPFLYTQCQPIHARSVVPLQDTPRTRLRFEATLAAPPGLEVLMAAEALGNGRFQLEQPIAPYLFAFAVGRLGARELGPRSRVWAESPLLDQAAWEFADTEQVLAAGEALFGPYDWQRYDLLVLPPSFPYGGMENPRLTFLTPSVLAGDRSLVAVIAHELAHSWTGNLISNANAEHFWLNEGGATYAERRIVEAIWGTETAALEWALGRRKLDRAVERLAEEGRPRLSRLRTELAGIDPDDAYTIVPYEKGALLLRALEEAVGRPVFDAFIAAYIDRFRFGVLTTEEFVDFLGQHLDRAAIGRVGLERWLYEPGVPADAPQARSARLEAIAALGGRPPADDQAAAWSATEWQLYIESIETPAPSALLEGLDERFKLTQRENYDILEQWLVVGIDSGYAPAVARVQDVLGRIGRMKYLRPWYRALAQRAETRGVADSLFERYAATYHPIARQVVADVLARSTEGA